MKKQSIAILSNSVPRREISIKSIARASVKVACYPKNNWRSATIIKSIQENGGIITDPNEAEILVWVEQQVALELPDIVNLNMNIKLVQLPFGKCSIV